MRAVERGFDHLRDFPPWAEFVERLATLGRVITFDCRGTGLSDRPAEQVSLEARADDLLAVLDAVESKRAQLSPVYGMLCTDIDNDGNLDVVCAGNSYAPEVQTGRDDAQGMLILKGNGKGSFVADRTEFNTASDNKAISSIQSVDGSRLLLVSSNSGSLKAYRVNQQTKQIPLTDADVYAVITNKNDKTYKEEFQFGNSYLSQSSRRLNVAAGTKSLMIYDNKGNKREVKL